ncbi:MAG: hypothetical protein IT438_13990 [Phycisphaerales bacterium]|nr:hypothetical protein [Phycisphaerales bacterium]
MIHPAPTSPIAPTLARGVLAASGPHAVIEFPNTNYQVHLVPTAPITSPVGKRIVGTITARARRVDVVDTGGSFVEPVAGRPRRVQGRVVAIDPRRNTIVVNAGVPIHLVLTDERQEAGQFEPGSLVSTDVLDGATFTAQ